MSTAVASSHTSSLPSTSVERQISPRHFSAIGNSAGTSSAPPANVEPSPRRARSNGSPEERAAAAVDRPASDGGNSSPASVRTGALPAIKVKKEPASPSLTTPSSRPRPKRLDLSSSMANPRGPSSSRPSAPLTSRESAGLAIQDVGLACLSPGFQTNDPSMREQLQRSLDVRNQQRQIIEARQKGSKTGSSHEQNDGPRTQDTTLFGAQTARAPSNSRRKGPPPGLSIAAPSPTQFANDRVIQSAPLHQTFTGLRPGEFPQSRHAQHGPSNLSQTSHIHHVPANQTNNRLPPITDVFGMDRFDGSRRYSNNRSPSNPSLQPLAQSPGYYSGAHGHPLSSRGREFRSAEEAVQGLSGGRDELLPKVVHYGGAQPPTPPSPMPPQYQQQHQQNPAGAYHHMEGHDHPAGPGRTIARISNPVVRTASAPNRRRDRDEFERDHGSSPSSMPRHDAKRVTTALGGGSEDDDWRAGLSSSEKKAEFLRLCERAWDLFHS